MSKHKFTIFITIQSEILSSRLSVYGATNREKLSDRASQRQQSSKTTFPCPACGLHAWAKPDVHVICGVCYDHGKGSYG